MNARFGIRSSFGILFGLLMTATAGAQKPASHLESAPALQKMVDQAVRRVLQKFADKKLESNQLAVTLVDLRNLREPVQASYRGHVQVYPASVIKLFYLVATHRWIEDGKIRETDEVRRALRDMIVDSSNEATHYLIDLLTDTTSGPELSPDELERWYDKRNAVNRYFAALGYQNINANRKPWCEGPYGRESQSVKIHQPNHRNWLTTDATARLLTEIVTGRAVSSERSAAMMTLLKRDPFSQGVNLDNQARGFTGLALSAGDRLWSKAGWTSETRHDAAYVERADGVKFVLVTFTTGHATEREIIPEIARSIVASLNTER